MEKLLINKIQNHYYDNMIYYFDTSEIKEYDELKELLKKDYGFLDVVLDFDDYKLLKTIYEQIPNDLDINAIKTNDISDINDMSTYKNTFYTMFKKSNMELNAPTPSTLPISAISTSITSSHGFMLVSFFLSISR